MNNSEYLDKLLEQHILGGKQPSPIDEGFAPMLATAKLLVKLQAIALPPRCASRLEATLRARIHHLRRL